MFNIFNGCLTKGTGCIASTEPCSSYTGTATQCNSYKGNSFQCFGGEQKACLASTIVCNQKTNAANNQDCANYKSTCVLKYGGSTCQDNETDCTSYSVAAISTYDKYFYCSTVQTISGSFCAYDPATPNTCIATKACKSWSLALTESCTDYAGTGKCTVGEGGLCFEQVACNQYTVLDSLSEADKRTQCNKFWDTKGYKCTYGYGATGANCKSITTCKEVISPTTANDCYKQSKSTSCALVGTSCVTISVCGDYNISSISVSDRANYCASKKMKENDSYYKCKYDSGDTCSKKLCEDIQSPTSQSNCDSTLIYCNYYGSKCYTISPCNQYTFPDTVNQDYLRRMFCQNMYNSTTKEFCSFTNGMTTCDSPKSCADYLVADSTDETMKYFCQERRDKTGVKCTFVLQQLFCSAPQGDEVCNLTTGMSVAICDQETLRNVCKIVDNLCVFNDPCDQHTETQASQCQGYLDNNGQYCTYDSIVSSAHCSDGKNACSQWNDASVSDCSALIDKYGQQCTWESGSKCTSLSPSSQIDCDMLADGSILYNGECSIIQAACNSYTFTSTVDTVDKKFTYCNGRVSSSGDLCTFVNESSSACSAAQACDQYPANGTSFSDKKAYCAKLVTTDKYNCTYSSSAKCLKIADLCTSYTVTASADCSSLVDTMKRPCTGVGSATTCSYPLCSSIASPTSQSDCNLKSANCVYKNGSCVQTPVVCTSYQTGGSGAIAFCSGKYDTNGVLCRATKDNDSTCIARTCTDTEAASFTTNAQCQTYSRLCKSNGSSCVDISTACTNFKGDCTKFLDINGESQCASDGASNPNTPAACNSQTCEGNTTATKQSDCDNYNPGAGCRWKNTGCVDKTVPCSSYTGTATECKAFIGNGIKCTGDSPTSAACRDSVCTDKATAANEAECTGFVTGCVFNGVGCMDKSSDCSSFQGTSATCKNFKGVNGTIQCWSASTTIGACTSGTKSCSYFTGNDSTCSQFTASDGPCKASSIGTTSPCTPKVCEEAPNSLITDKQCKEYHPSCKTNGRGCSSTVLCKDFQTQNACSASTSCVWTQSCKIVATTCSALTTEGPSACVNNQQKKCAWYNGNGTPANAVCRDYTCADYDVTLISHDDCMKASNNKCTTNGAGCVSYGICTSYINSLMCSSAQTTEASKKCAWENNKCRQQQCKDLKGSTDPECNKQIAGCKSNGTICIGPTYDCSTFNGSQKLCLIDSSGQPCLYVDGICYSYDNCTDVTQPTQQFCQLFSTNCVVGPSTCVALNQCSLYDNQISCIKGVNNTVCGWLPTQACAQFNKCSDALGTTLPECAAWNSSCVSDGTACVPIGDCTTYLKQQSCENNYDTAQNACFWTGTACKLKQCSDITAATDALCVTNIVKEGYCTTDGTKCVVRGECKSYLTQAACTVGTDAIPCQYGYPVGQTTGTQSCRPQECTDIIGATNEQCRGAINKKACVSNGTNCISQGTCASYKNKLSCDGGGSDTSTCVWTTTATTATTTDPLAGTCAAFSSCESANGNSAICALNQSCKYSETTKKCDKVDCTTFNTSGKCLPFPSFDGKSYTICVSSSKGCQASDPTSIAQTDCYSTVSRYSYTWNDVTSKCQSCKGTSTTNSTNNQSEPVNNTNAKGQILEISIAVAFLGFMI